MGQQVQCLLRCVSAATMLQEAGRIEEALSLYQQAADRGDTAAYEQASAMLIEVGRIEKAIDWLQSAPTSDYHEAGCGVGRRDYAILLLLTRLSLRAGEVIGILDDPDWRAGERRVTGKADQAS